MTALGEKAARQERALVRRIEKLDAAAVVAGEPLRTGFLLRAEQLRGELRLRRALRRVARMTPKGEAKILKAVV